MNSLKPAPGKPGIFNLHEGENIKCCPFTIAIPSQDNYGRISLIQQPCGTQCALFEVEKIEETNKTRARLACCDQMYYDIEPDTENKFSIVK